VTIQERFAKLEPRERTLVTALGGLVAVLLFLGLPYLLLHKVSQARSDNQEIRDYIEKVNDSRAKIEVKRAAQDTVLARYAKPLPANLASDAAKAQNVAIADDSKKPDVPHGKKFTEHVEVFRMNKAGLVGISKMLETLETAGYPVAVSRLNIKPRQGEADSYDVEMGVSTFERKPDVVKGDKSTPHSGVSADASAEPSSEAP
jgi:general secretion pathway protein M